ncbi:MAG: tRNA (adenosine(37)-N6)-threonylcarbamoyltransferase complex ATPase subunit type 1 TsaE [Streptococcaceae bacterium]|jgi:tRNA threonylcarbamoyladenosine biosynthesis protein TsaE|nr:tRNA (adenosine(37)-N6)-threonylcarbamoyltransferase complex ATPase subunit type 1 TsaE [Streptococcaceae bacterium]
MEKKLSNLTESALTDVAERLGEKLSAGDILILTGDLGAGKTTFTKGLGRALGIVQMIKSPTFMIVREYQGASLKLYHMDVYRIGDDPDSFDMEDYFDAGGVCVIEWGELLGADMPANYLSVKFDKNANDTRTLTLTAHGKRYETLLSAS